MGYARIALAVVCAGALALAFPSRASAQVCLGIPAEPGEISVHGEVISSGSSASYGGRLGMNFNTEFAFDFGLRRPLHDDGRGLILNGGIAYEMEDYRPPVCFTFGVRHERRPLADGGEATRTLIPIGLGVGKRLGSAKSFSLALFLRPEYLIRLKPDPEQEYESFWGELGERSEGRGTIGLLMATPFLYATGSLEIATRDYTPSVSIGVGVTF